MTELYTQHLARQGFELGEKIGSGLSGKTMIGCQNSLGRSVAIKFFDSAFNRKNLNLKKKFLRESKLLAELQHPSIPYVITSGNIPGIDTPYIVMQYISGETLDEYIKNNSPVLPEVALHISIQILDALSFVHSKNIIHRDIKPSNIMILPSGHCYLIDFSIGFKIDPEAGLTRATRTGDHLGSVQYMSPEQSQNMKNVDQRSDIYSYSKVLCELLSGRPEVSGLDEVNLPSALKKVISKGLSYEADDRYGSANEYLRELKQVSSSTLPFMDIPSKAVCNNTKCPSADWSSQGYYRGAYFIDDSINSHCTSCGNKLIYQCGNCGCSIDNTKHCGGCGAQQFYVPECKKCGSYLKKVDMGKDTELLGCEKCNSKPPAQVTYQVQQIPKQSPNPASDEELPF